MIRGVDGNPWLVVTGRMVDDPAILRMTFITSSNFKKQPDSLRMGPVAVFIKITHVQIMPIKIRFLKAIRRRHVQSLFLFAVLVCRTCAFGADGSFRVMDFLQP